MSSALEQQGQLLFFPENMSLEKFPQKQTHNKRLKWSCLAKRLSSVRLKKKPKNLKRDWFLAKPNSFEVQKEAVVNLVG